MKKIIFIIASLLFIMSCDQSSGDNPAPENKAYVGSWADTAGTTTYTLTNTTFDANSPMTGPTKGTMREKSGTDNVLILNTTEIQGAPVSAMTDAQKQPLLLLGVIMVDQEITWAVSGDTLTITIEGNDNVFTKQ